MENSKIIDWIIANKNQFKLNVINVSGLSKVLEGYHDFVVEISIKSKRYCGRGTDANEEVAFLKAFSESVERFLTEKYKLATSSGVSVHWSIEKCKENSLEELIERDIFLCHFLLGGNLKYFDSEKTLFYKSQLEKNKIAITFYKLSSSDEGHCVLALIGNKNKITKLIFGISYKKHLDDAIEHAVIESLRDYLAVGNIQSDLDVEGFLKIQNYKIEDHKNIGLNEKYTSLYFGSRKNEVEIKEIAKEKVVFQKLELEEDLQGCPLVSIRATSSEAQSLWIGITTKEAINYERLRSIRGDFEICNIPHFFN